MSGHPVEIEGLVVAFGAKVVLDGVTLDVREREILAVMGASGGGKTTLLKAVAGLVPIQKGTVRVAGLDVARDPEASRMRLGLVFQHGALFDYLSVRDNVLFGLLRSRRLGPKDAAQVAERLLESVSLGGTGDLLPSELSGGMRKRVALARALALEPSVLLYDEPTSGLDPVTAYSIDRLIADTRDRTGSSAVVVSHDPASVMRTADRVAFLVAGRLAYLGPKDGLAGSGVPEIEEVVLKAKAESFA